jgi:hypothetical protein
VFRRHAHLLDTTDDCYRADDTDGGVATIEFWTKFTPTGDHAVQENSSIGLLALPESGTQEGLSVPYDAHATVNGAWIRNPKDHSVG